ncbi:lipoate--protein ligase family protein [Candidatus Pacearchaeota archaeon]|nr:lipoate--protein ligase family protein [Candidatus Pacearchaeota archaeon]
MKLRIIPHKRANAGWNLALEEALFLKAKQDLLRGRKIQPIVKLYSFSNPSVVLGYMQKISEINYDYCMQNNVDVTMRTTGGGSVYLGKNDMQYSIITGLGYSKELLRRINMSIINALQNVGFSPNLVIKDKHPIVRMNGKGFIFDAQRRFKNLILHHGTALVDNSDYFHMPQALKASREELNILQNGNIWLRQEAEIREKSLIKSFEKELPEDMSVVRKDFTNSEIKLAKKLYKNFYTNFESFRFGKKKFGICYLTSTPYDMELYAEEDKDV